jgi:hypothetical protein
MEKVYWKRNPQELVSKREARGSSFQRKPQKAVTVQAPFHVQS